MHPKQKLFRLDSPPECKVKEDGDWECSFYIPWDMMPTHKLPKPSTSGEK